MLAIVWRDGSCATITTRKTLCRKHLCARFVTSGRLPGGNGRAWFLTIVRNTCSGLNRHRFDEPVDVFDEQHHSHLRPSSSPETLLLQTDDVMVIERAMNSLPARSRELLRLRELEGLSYRAMADTLGIPIGTVMSGLARARQAFREALAKQTPAH